LTVAHHIKKIQVRDFEMEKQVNPGNKKDVDVLFRFKSMIVAIEVKCPFKEEPVPDPGTITLQTAGRTEGVDQTYEQINEQLESQSSSTRFERGETAIID
jgi:hypothetical protein